jgi:hypothetical protein
MFEDALGPGNDGGGLLRQALANECNQLRN